MDTLELIRTFREVALRGSFSVAARTLDISKATVSKYVAALEARLGNRLLNRTTRTISLTDAGNLLLKRSTPLLEMIDLTRDELDHHSRQPSGRLRIIASVGLGYTELPTLLVDFMRQYPDVHLTLDLSNRPIDMVDEGIDVALRIGSITDSNLIVRKLRAIELVLCASPAYWQQRGMPLHPDDLAEHDALTYALDESRDWRFMVDGKLHLVPVKSRMAATDSSPLLYMALQNLGIVNMPRMLIKKHLDSGALLPALESFQPNDAWWLYATYTQRRHNSAALKALLAFMEERWKA